MFLTSSTFLAQKQSVYSKTFEINENATAFLKLSDGSVDVEIELSTDGKFHVDYDIDFKEYPKRKRDDILENIKVEAKMIDNHIMLSNESNSTYSSFSQKLLSGLYKRKQAKKTKYYQKSKDSLLKEIKENILPKSFYIDFIEKSGAWNEKQKKRSINKYNKRDKKRFQKRFTIKIPSNLKLKINAENTTVRINNNLSNQLSIRLDKGKIFVKSLKNKNNIIKIKDGVFIAEEIKGGKLTLDNVFKGQIGSLTNVNLDTEFSNLEIGEIKKIKEQKYAEGGYVSGAGSGTSDSIPARLSNGEFVQKASAVDYYGVDYMNAINNKKIPKFAMGGLVTPTPINNAARSVSKGIEPLSESVSNQRIEVINVESNFTKTQKQVKNVERAATY